MSLAVVGRTPIYLPSKTKRSLKSIKQASRPTTSVFLFYANFSHCFLDNKIANILAVTNVLLYTEINTFRINR